METKEERMARIKEENRPWIYFFEDDEIENMGFASTQDTYGLIQQSIWESFQMLKEMKAPQREYLKVLKWAAEQSKIAWNEEIAKDRLKGWKIA